MTNKLHKVPLQPLEVPAGWTIIWNNFWAIDPAPSLETLQSRGLMTEHITDIWQEVMVYFFEASWLWRAHRNDLAYELTLEWTPLADENGCYLLTECQSRSVTFAQPPKQRIDRQLEGINLRYVLQPTVEWASEPTRCLESRSRQTIVETLN